MMTRPQTPAEPPLDAKPFATATAMERWEIDPARSRLGFVLRHLVVSEIGGRFASWGGTLFVDRDDLRLSTLHLWIDLATIETGEVQRDGHLRSSELLDVARFPKAEFEGTAVELVGGKALVRGRLELHGIARDVELAVEPGAAPASGSSTYRVRGRLDRQSFGLHWNQDLDVGGVVVADEIKLDAEVFVTRSNGDAKGGR